MILAADPGSSGVVAAVGDGMGGHPGAAAAPAMCRRSSSAGGSVWKRERPCRFLGGGRLTGKIGQLSVGALNIQTDDEPTVGAPATNFTVIRLKRDILRRSRIGGIYTRRSASLEGGWLERSLRARRGLLVL